MRLKLWLAIGLGGFCGLGGFGAWGARAAPPPDGLLLQEGAWMIELAPFLRRVGDAETAFVLRNEGDKDLSLELELAQPPIWLRFAPAPRLRLFDSLGREFVSAPAAPHRIAFTLPQGGLTHFTLRMHAGVLPPKVALRLWAGAARQDFAARVQALRRAIVFALALLYALALLAGALARAWDGLLIAAAGGLALGAYALPWWRDGSLTLALALGGAAALLWLGFHARALMARQRLYLILLALGNLSLLALAVQSALLQILPQWQSLRAPLLMELVFVSMLLALALGSFSLSVLAQLVRQARR